MRSLVRFLLRLLHLVNLTLGGLAILAVALAAAFLSMRLAIHGREVNVPNFAGLSNADAEALAKSLGLNLQVENRFYSSAVAPNHVLSQSPLQGNRVRRGWQVRVTESLGPQRVAVPNVIGQPERAASLSLRRLGLDVHTIAYLPPPAEANIDPGTVIAQSPPPDATSAEASGTSLLVAGDPLPPSSFAYVMPSLIGLTLSNASSRLAFAGLHIASAQSPSDIDATNPPSEPAVAFTSEPTTTRSVIISQTPLPGRRVTRADNIRVTLSR